jgi:broad specificity phosphatase PhoE
MTRNLPTANQVLLMRHWQLDVGPEICVGQLDLPLSADGMAAAQRFAHDWAAKTDLRPAEIICSDLLRAQQSAAPLAAALHIPIRLEPRLRELHMGSFTGLQWDQIQAQFPAQMAAWGEHWVTQGPPGGESFNQLQARAGAALADVVPGLPGSLGSRALLVCHAGPMRALLGHAAGMAPALAMQMPIAYGQCLVLRGNG